MREWTPALRARLASLRLTPAREAAIVEELSQHLDDRRQELISGGATPEAATARILAELEHTDRLTAQLATLKQSHAPHVNPPGIPARRPLSGLWQDLRYTLRTLGRQPTFAVVAVLTLALGIGLNTAMFSFMNTLLLRPLPFPDSASLVRLYRSTPQHQHGAFSPADYLALDQEETGFGRFAAYQQSSVTFSEPGRATQWLRVSADLFDVLGVPPTLGRSFRPDEEIAGNHRIVVISHAFWRDRFSSAPDIIGRTVEGNGEQYEIVGVLPPAAGDHRLFGQVGLFSPFSFDESARRERNTHALTVLGLRDRRLSTAEGAAFLSSFAARMAADFPTENDKSTWRSEGLPTSATGPAGRILLGMLLGLSGCVLLIACSNLANLLLARAIERTREFAVRAALGASRLQLVRTLVLESTILSIAGGACALVVATWTTGWLRSIIANAGGPSFDFELDWRVLSFALCVSLLTLAICGVGPALFTSRINTNDTLKSGGRGATADGRQQRLRHALIIGQFALAMILLAGAGFFVRGTTNALTVHYGWTAEHVVQANISVPDSRYPDRDAINLFHRRLIARVSQLPGVASVSTSYGLPYLGLNGNGRYVAAADAPMANGPEFPAKINGIAPAYFEVTGTRLLAGRAFNDTDTALSPKVAIVNETMARTLFPAGRALGGRIGDAGSTSPAWMEIVGVVADVRSIDVAQEPANFQLYQPIAQDPPTRFMVAVRTTGVAAGPISAAIGSAIAELDPDLTVRGLMPVTSRMEEVTSQMQMCQQLLVAFALLGLLLACLGIYGAMTRMVAQRTGEIGLRMALGAQVSDVLGLVLASGSRIVAIGAGAGLVGAFALSRLLASVLPTMQTDGGLVGGAGAILLVAVALVACYLPARRAAQVSPLEALRAE
jgi:putative ABC transport system permease protein